MRDITIMEDYFFANFGESLRFSFDVWTFDIEAGSVGTISTRVKTIKKKDTMYLYFKFYSDDGLIFDEMCI